MTGQELISFIKENKLEDAKITFNELGSHKAFQIGKWNVKDGGEYDTIVYNIFEDNDGDVKSEIEMCRLGEDDNGVATQLTSEEAIELRVERD